MRERREEEREGHIIPAAVVPEELGQSLDESQRGGREKDQGMKLKKAKMHTAKALQKGGETNREKERER